VFVSAVAFTSAKQNKQTLENTEWIFWNWQSRETCNIGYTTQRKIKQKHNTICDGHHYEQTDTNNLNKIWALLQSTGGKDKPNIVFMRQSHQTSKHRTQNVKIHNRTTEKTKKMSNADPIKKPGSTVCLNYKI
jgi:hypothetical protein